MRDARSVLAGYAFETETVEKRNHETTRPRWGYRTYDCIPPDPGPTLGPIDLLVAAGLNGRVNVKRMASLLQAAEPAGAALAKAEVPFWELEPEDLGHERPDSTSTAWPIWTAWETLMALPDIDVALTHKVLHHKRPDFIPLVDNKTLELLPERKVWITIHADLRQKGFEEMESWFKDLIHDRGEVGLVPLSRVRIHDILLWGSRGRQRKELIEAGKRFLRSKPG